MEKIKDNMINMVAGSTTQQSIAALESARRTNPEGVHSVVNTNPGATRDLLVSHYKGYKPVLDQIKREDIDHSKNLHRICRDSLDVNSSQTSRMLGIKKVITKNLNQAELDIVENYCKVLDNAADKTGVVDKILGTTEVTVEARTLALKNDLIANHTEGVKAGDLNLIRLQKSGDNFEDTTFALSNGSAVTMNSYAEKLVNALDTTTYEIVVVYGEMANQNETLSLLVFERQLFIVFGAAAFLAIYPMLDKLDGTFTIFMTRVNQMAYVKYGSIPVTFYSKLETFTRKYVIPYGYSIGKAVLFEQFKKLVNPIGSKNPFSELGGVANKLNALTLHGMQITYNIGSAVSGISSSLMRGAVDNNQMLQMVKTTMKDLYETWSKRRK